MLFVTDRTVPLRHQRNRARCVKTAQSLPSTRCCILRFFLSSARRARWRAEARAKKRYGAYPGVRTTVRNDRGREARRKAAGAERTSGYDRQNKATTLRVQLQRE